MRWLLLCLISVGYAQVLPYTDVNSTNTVTLSNKTITSAANTLTIDCNIATCTNFPAGASGANPTGTVGLTAVNGSSGSFLRADGAPPLSQSISPTWTGTHTFNGTVAGTALSTYLASPPAIGGSSPAAGTFTQLVGTSGSISGLTTFGIRDTSAAFDVTLAAVSSTALTAGRTLTFDVKNVAHTLAFGSTANTITFPSASSYTVIGSGDSGTVTNAILATAANNTVKGNATSGTASETDLSVGSCSTSASALIWTTNTGFGCNTSINAATLGGATFAAPGAIGSGTAAAGNFTTLGTSGLLSPALGITVTGADANILASDNHNTNINTGTSTGTFTAGQNSATPGSVVLKGPVSFQAGTAYSGASWATTSPVWNMAASTLNDTTASGTITTEGAYSIQQPTFTSTGGASTTITSATVLWIAAPVCTGGLVCTSLYSAYFNGGTRTNGNITGVAGSNISGGTVNLNASSNNVTNINTGSSNAAIHIGDGSGNNTIGIGNGTGVVTGASPWTFSNAAVKMTGITTGTNADTVCLKADGTLLIQAAACTISSLRFKEDVKDVQDSTIPEISSMRVASFRMKDGKSNGDPNAASTQVGLIAENIASVAPECAIYESDMKTPKSYRQECVIALLVKGEQELVKQNAMLKAELRKLEAR